MANKILSMIIVTVLLTPLSVASVPLPIVQTAYAYEHLTEEYYDVDADGTWYSSLDANEIEYYNFDLAEPRETQYVTVQVLSPRDATVEVYVDGEEIGVAGVHAQYFVVSLATGSHEVAISNEGQTPVEYFLYLGHVNFGGSCGILGVDPCAFISNLLSGVTNILLHGITDPILNALFFSLFDPLHADHTGLATDHDTLATEHTGQASEHSDLQATLDHPDFGLQEIKAEIIDISAEQDGATKQVSVTVHLGEVNIKNGEVLVLLDTTGSGTLSVVHVAANLPCTAVGPAKTPNVLIKAGVAGGALSDVIESAADDTGFVGPKKTCVFHDTVTSAELGHDITDVILINTGSSQELKEGTLVTITGTYE